MTSFLNNCLSISVIDSLEDCKYFAKFEKQSLNKLIFKNWKIRFFKLFLSSEYSKYDLFHNKNSKNNDNNNFKILVYYEDEKLTVRKGIIIIREDYFNVQLFDRNNNYYSISLDVYKLAEDGISYY